MKFINHKICALLAGLVTLASSAPVMAGDGPAYKRHDLDLSQYNKFRLSELSMENMQVLKPAWEDDPEAWTFPAGTRDEVQNLFREIMTEEVLTVAPEATTVECMELMTERRVRHLPVVAEGRVLGVISIGDVVRSVIEEQRFLIEQLENYITR